MKCPQCGFELPDDANFCRRCGEVLGTGSADDDYESRYETMTFDPPRPPARRYAQAGSPTESSAPERGRYAAQLPTASAAPAAQERYAAPAAAPEKKKPTAWIVCIAVLLLAALVAAGTIFYLRAAKNNDTSEETTSGSEALQQAISDYLPPAEAIEIDTTLEDPSNDRIKFAYDERARIASCSYTVNEKEYDQTYDYDDTARKVTVKTAYRKEPILTKELSYDSVKVADRFEVVEGYYLRLDEQSLEQAPAEGPDAPAREAPSIDDSYKELYINFLKNTETTYHSGQLFYLNDDDIPELSLDITAVGATTRAYRICWISNGEVLSTDIGAMGGCAYTERSGVLTAIYIRQTSGGFSTYSFDGVSLDEIQSGSWDYGRNADTGELGKRYKVDGVSVTEDEYLAARGDTENKKNVAENNVSESELPEYIRSFG